MGLGEYGQLGTEDSEKPANLYEPCLVSALKGKFVKKVGAGWWHTIAVVSASIHK
jgi:hypothetical protein